MTESSTQRQGGAGTEIAKARTADEWLSGQAGVEIQLIDGKKLISLPRDLEQKTNCLVPFSQVIQLSSNFSPVPRLVQLSEGDFYVETKGKDQDARKKNESRYALSKVGLNKLADIAQIERHRVSFDEMGGAGVRAHVIARRRRADGGWQTEEDTRTTRFARMEEKIRNEAIGTMQRWRNTPKEGSDEWNRYIQGRIDTEYENVDQKTATKAWLRCVRAILSIKPTYSKAELQKPFFVISYAFTPNLADPNVRQLVAAEYSGATEDLYGGEEAPFAPAGDVPAAPVQEAPAPAAPAPAAEPAPEPDEEGVVDAQVVDEDGEGDAWDWDDGSAEDADAVEPVEEPENNPKFRGGPYQGKSMKEVVASEDGQKWLAQTIPSQRADRRPLALGWLSFALQQEVTEENLPELFT